ncbi:family 43 glycosylhydrolase [Arundinibacter roseus]|nr:family 43 glycosylhydrolase [Arundinibacter roseus]
MKHFLRITLCFLTIHSTVFSQQKPIVWNNPIREGLNVYGMKDFYLLPESNSFFLVGTSYKNHSKNVAGLVLYKSNNLKKWEEAGKLIDTKKLSKQSWFYDIFNAPEIHTYNNKYYLIFNGGNSLKNPYKKTGFGIAVSSSATGPYQVLNADKMLFESNHTTLVFDEHKQPFVFFEMDGRFYSVKIDLENGKTFSEPTEFLGPKSLGEKYKYLDAPQFYVKDGKFHLVFSQFYAGYIIKVFHYAADSLHGKYSEVQDPLYTWLEAEADEGIKAQYPTINGFAPPTQVIFSNQVVELQKGKFGLVYHSSEKYSEPALCIDTFDWENDQIKIHNPKSPFQGINLGTTTRFMSTHGYENCLEIKNEKVRVVIEPNLGGRVLIYEIAGKNIMYVDTTQNGWTLEKNGFTQPSAGRFDIGPEAVTPKRNTTWAGAWKPEIIDNKTVRITSKKDSVAGIQMVREFRLEANSTQLSCTQLVKNISNEEISGNHWGRTFAVGGGIALVPKNPKSRYPKGYCIYRPPFNGIDFKPAAEPNVNVKENIIEIKNTPSQPKFVMDNVEGWLAYAAPNDLLFIKKYPIYPNRVYGEVTAATSSIWYYKDTMVEIEPIGPLEVLKPNESFSFTEDWWLTEYDFPGDRNLNIAKIKQIIEVLK